MRPLLDFLGVQRRLCKSLDCSMNLCYCLSKTAISLPERRCASPTPPIGSGQLPQRLPVKQALSEKYISKIRNTILVRHLVYPT